MPDFKSLVITDLADASLTVNRFSVSLTVNDSNTGALVQDFTGANAIVWPNVLAQLTAQQKKSLYRMLITRIIYMKMGQDPGDVGV